MRSSSRMGRWSLQSRWRACALLLAAVLASAAVNAEALLPRVFIETDVSSRDPYVQAATRVTVRVYSARALYHPDLDLPASADALVRQIGNDDHGTAERDGRSYDVLTRQYLVFPQHSGKLALPGATLSAQVLTSTGRPDPFRNDYGYGAMSIAVEPLQLRGPSLSLDVRPRPASAVGSYWMPARQVTLTSSWQPESLAARVGDALTLDVTVQAEGLTAEQLPDLTTLIAPPPGLKVYPEEPKLDNSTQGDTVVGRRQQSIALIADRPGRYTVPELRLSWWDTGRDGPQVVDIPARTIDIRPAPPATPAGAARDAAQGGGLASTLPRSADPWRWATLALGAAWLLTLAGWYGTQRRRRPGTPLPQPVAAGAPGAARARSAFREACARHDARAARRHLLAWAGAEWPRSPPSGLNALARRIGDGEIERMLRELERACFAGGAWRGEGLAGAFEAWPKARAGTGRRETPERKSPLEPLYP